jgi:hypothetical protein
MTFQRQLKIIYDLMTVLDHKIVKSINKTRFEVMYVLHIFLLTLTTTMFKLSKVTLILLLFLIFNVTQSIPIDTATTNTNANTTSSSNSTTTHTNSTSTKNQTASTTSSQRAGAGSRIQANRAMRQENRAAQAAAANQAVQAANIFTSVAVSAAVANKISASMSTETFPPRPIATTTADVSGGEDSNADVSFTL